MCDQTRVIIVNVESEMHVKSNRTTSKARHLLVMLSLSSLLQSSRPFVMQRAAYRNFPALFSATTTDSSALVNGRISKKGDESINLRLMQDNLDMVISHLKSRRANEETLDKARQIGDLNQKRVGLLQERDGYLSTRKEQSAIVGQLMREGKADEAEGAKAISSKAAGDAARVEAELSEVEEQVNSLLDNIPNLLDDLVPDGDSEEDNVEVSSWGNEEDLPEELGWTDEFEPKWHDDIAAGLNGWMGENAVKISGARFAALSGQVARLERALCQFFMDIHTMEHGYTEVSVPYVVGRSSLEGTSQLPKFEEDLFSIRKESHTCNGEDAFLIPTAEVPLTNMHREQILEECDLPISYCALTPCFRAEAGSYGRDTKGLFRMHQFLKVELVKITSAAESDEQHEQLTSHAQTILEALKLPYRKVRLCSGDIGFSARHCYDLEVWLPGQGAYREISSCSNTGDFQARRMGLRYRPSEKAATSVDGNKGGKKKKARKPKPELCHTINGSGVAVGRALIAVLENYQKPDGSVIVPEVLRPYMGGVELLTSN